MRPYGRGILPQAQIYLYDIPEPSRRMFLYPLRVGHYECDADYIVDRTSFDSFLLLYIKRGTGYFLDQFDRRVELPPNSFALIDCYRPHEYGAVEPLEMYWIHFDGPTARPICQAIIDEGSFIPRNLNRCRDTLVELCERTARSGPVGAALANRMLVNILTEFLLSGEEISSGSVNKIDDIRGYILDNLDRNLSLEDLARRANLSPYHFSRTFKQHVGVSPHDYLIEARVNLAAFYLKSSNESIKNIARVCGFSSEASFCTTFKRRLGVTPTGYRAAR